MRKKMMLLALVLAATAASLTAPQAKALGGGPSHLCPVCYLLADGSECCIYCRCYDNGSMICPENACIPAI